MKSKYSKQVVERMRFELMFIHLSSMEAYKNKENESPDEHVERIKTSLDEISKYIKNINDYLNNQPDKSG